MNRTLAMAAMFLCAGALQAQASNEDGKTPEKKVIELKAQRVTANLVRPGSPKSDAEEFHFVGIDRECHFDSRVNHYVRIYVNGVYRGTMGPWGDLYPFVGDCHDDVTVLYAESTCGRYCWSRTVYGCYTNFHWILRP